MAYTVNDFRTPREALAKLAALIETLREPVFDLADPADFKPASALFNRLVKIPTALYGDQDGAEKLIPQVKGWVEELERILAGQMHLFASETERRTAFKKVVANLQPVFDGILEILDLIVPLVQKDTMRNLGIKPAPRGRPSGRPSQPQTRAPKTYAKAQLELMDLLTSKGWDVKRGLKVPHAADPSKRFRLWFKPEAIYLSQGSSHTLGTARSISHLFGDIRFSNAQAIYDKLAKYLHLPSMLSVDRHTLGS